jgi:hypothetical protein
MDRSNWVERQVTTIEGIPDYFTDHGLTMWEVKVWNKMVQTLLKDPELQNRRQLAWLLFKVGINLKFNFQRALDRELSKEDNVFVYIWEAFKTSQIDIGSYIWTLEYLIQFARTNVCYLGTSLDQGSGNDRQLDFYIRKTYRRGKAKLDRSHFDKIRFRIYQTAKVTLGRYTNIWECILGKSDLFALLCRSIRDQQVQAELINFYSASNQTEVDGLKAGDEAERVLRDLRRSLYYVCDALGMEIPTDLIPPKPLIFTFTESETPDQTTSPSSGLDSPEPSAELFSWGEF